MKKISVLISIAILAISFTICGCENKITAETSTVPSESVLNTPASMPVSTAEPPKDTIVTHYSYPTPDYEYQLWLSDDVIMGEVVEELEGRYSNPDGALKEVGNAWVTPYLVRVDKSYRGILPEGETVIVDVWNLTDDMLTPENEDETIVVTGYDDFYLHEGQRGIFMLDQTKYITYDNREPMYGVVFGDEGVFEPKESEVALTSEDAEVVYASPSFEITLDQITADIAKADELYGERDTAEK